MTGWTLWIVIACSSLGAAQTFTKDVAPIVFKYCSSCHRPGEAAPFSLLDYSSVKAHARQIAEATKSRYMPPWKPAPGSGEFEGERRLSDAQIHILEDWTARGAPEGDPKDLPAKPTFSEGWQMGPPDLVVTADRPYGLSASGSDVFRNFVLRAPVNRVRYVRAVEIRPGTKKVVHHANLLVDRGRTLRRRDGKDGAPGFSGMDVQIETKAFDPESHFLFWKPGTTTLEHPPGMAWQIGPDTDLILNMHLQPSGKPEAIQPSVGLYFTDQPPVKQPMLLQMEHDGALDIPAGMAGFLVSDTLTLPVDVDVLAVYPHAHYLGRDLNAVVTLPDGSRRSLIRIPDWDLNWQAVYQYKKPVYLPKGSVVTIRYTYDNSVANPRNPSQPPVRVVAGDRSIDEMAHLWLQVLPRKSNGGDPRRALQRSVMLRRLDKYPQDFQAHFSLGSMFEEEGQLDPAMRHYRAALKVEPKNATAHNSLGSALLASGQQAAAADEFRAAIDCDPDYADAHYNLAQMLLAKQDIPGAIRHLRDFIRIEPKDAPALSDLGAGLAMLGQTEQAFRYLREAVELQPDYFNGRFNLAQALAAAGRMREAEAEFREALKLKPQDKEIIEALKQFRP